ncbi:MAG: Lrp/AsnC family transcriptional regulator [Candidatus Pristimantibacillus sp.]
MVLIKCFDRLTLFLKGASFELDQTDKRIIEELSQYSRIKMKDLGEKVHLTGPAAAARVDKLEDNGVIEGYSIKVNHAKLGCYTYAFLNIYIEGTHHQAYLSFIQAKEEHILNNYKISGEGCYLLECRFPSNEVLNQFLIELNKYANYKLSIVI